MDPLVLREIPDLGAFNGKNIDERARATAEALVKADRLKTHQLRNIYSSVDRLRSIYQQLSKKATNETEKAEMYATLSDQLFLLKPKLAYAAGRQKAVNDTLFPFLSAVINGYDRATDKEKAIRNFFALLESVVGYHKYFENIKNA
jgi:CRISPR-associated protein Csm2